MGDLIPKYLKVNMKWKCIHKELEQDLLLHQVFDIIKSYYSICTVEADESIYWVFDLFIFNFNKPLTGMHSPFVFFVTIWHSLGKQVHCSLEKCHPEGPFKMLCVFQLEKRSLNFFHSLALQFWCTVITSIAEKKKWYFLLYCLVDQCH